MLIFSAMDKKRLQSEMTEVCTNFTDDCRNDKGVLSRATFRQVNSLACSELIRYHAN